MLGWMRRDTLGGQLVALGFVTEHQLREAEHRAPPGRLGETLLELGICTRDQLHAALAKTAGSETIDAPRLGEVLIALDHLTEAKLAEVLAAQATDRRPLGQLLVEDNDGVRDIARTTLEEAGYTVVAVCNANEALVEVATGRRVDLVVSDLVMPGLGGRELVERLRANDPKLPVLYVSGFAADGPPVLDGTGVGFLAKPFSGTQLLASVRAVLPAAPA
jgi:CheY-like chemotaxis protein